MALMFDHLQNETIAAISTASAESGIGIIRISGPDAGCVTEKVFRNRKGGCFHIAVSWKPNTIHHGYITDPDTGEILDEVLVSWMKAPHSYTTEDTAEINTHGGPLVMQRVLDAVLRSGARPAEPGEFTKRAFLGGRIDLSEAEAVMKLIHARSEFGRKSAVAQLGGAVSEVIRQLRDTILHEIAFIEAALDDPDNYSLDGYPEKLNSICLELLDRINEILRRSEEGELLDEGIRTVIAGRPNVGKSSLMNLLAGNDKAIVTDIPGTTRDILESNVCLKYNKTEIRLHLMDTAGIHQTQDMIEHIGVDRAVQALEQAQLILFVLDGSEALQEEDREIACRIREVLPSGARCIVLVNKCDVRPEISGHEIDDQKIREMFAKPDLLRAEHEILPDGIIRISCHTAEGLDALRGWISELFHVGDLAYSEELLLVNERQRHELSSAAESLSLVCSGIRDGVSEDFYSIDLMNAYSALGRIIGESVEDDLVDKIFSEFCLGK